MTQAQKEETIEEFLAWYLSEPQSFRRLVLAILYSLPGSESLDDYFPEGIDIHVGEGESLVGWKEVELLEKFLSTLDEASDVRRWTEAILKAEGVLESGEDAE